MEFSPLLFLFSHQCTVTVEEADHQINNDSDHHLFGTVTADQIGPDGRTPRASHQMLNNLGRRAVPAARHHGLGGHGLGSHSAWTWTGSPAPRLAGGADILTQTGWNNRTSWPTSRKLQDWLHPMVSAILLGMPPRPPHQCHPQADGEMATAPLDLQSTHRSVHGRDGLLLRLPQRRRTMFAEATPNLPVHLFDSNGHSFLSQALGQ